MLEVLAIATLLAAIARSEEPSSVRTLLYRGSQRLDDRTVRGVPSYTPSIDVALVWSAVPGDAWSRRPPSFLPTSNVQAVDMEIARPLVLDEHGSHVSLSQVLDRLRHGEPGGITDEEVSRLLRWMHRRAIGVVPGGDFRYIVRDEEGEPIDPDDVEFSLVDPQTLLSQAQQDWEYGDRTVPAVEADAYVFADAPTVQKVAGRLGFDAIVYRDVFQGGKSASPALLGVDVLDLDGVEEELDLDLEYVPTHLTVRPLAGAVVREVWRKPSAEVLSQMSSVRSA